MAPDYVIKTLKFWYKEGVKTADEIQAMVPSKISQEECDDILAPQ